MRGNIDHTGGVGQIIYIKYVNKLKNYGLKKATENKSI